MVGTGHMPRWTDDDVLVVDGVEFVHSFEATPSADRFHIAKPREDVESYLDLLAERGAGGNVVELGIYQGGSAALASLVGGARRLLALDISMIRIAALDDLLAARGLGDVVRLRYGIDQADRMRLAGVVHEALEGEPVDLVIDDASHLLDPTRTSFEALFPLVRPGGAYVIEDWQSQHVWADGLAATIAADASTRAAFEASLGQREHIMPERPLSQLVLELILARASTAGAIGDLRIGRAGVVVERADAVLDPRTFRLTDLYEDRFGLLDRHLPEPMVGHVELP